MSISEVYIMQPYMRAAMPIKGAEEIRFNQDGLLEATYSIPEINATIANHHQYLYYMVKEGQIKGEIARNGVSILNVDMHHDFHNTGAIPPDIDLRKTPQEQLDSFWEYTDVAGINGFFVPLVYDGTMSSLSWLAYNSFASSDVSMIIDRYRVRSGIIPAHQAIVKKDGPEMIMEPWNGEHQSGTVDFMTLSFQSFPLHEALLFRGMSEEDIAKRFILSIDADRFVACDAHDPQRFSQSIGPNDLNYVSLMMFNSCLESIKRRIRRPRTFICTSSPIFTRPHTANVIIRRLINMLRD